MDGGFAPRSKRPLANQLITGLNDKGIRTSG